MADFYVDPSGNFVNSGATALLPVKTLQRAHDAASNGDTIYVQNTSEANPVRLPLVSTKNLTIRAAVEGDQFYCTSAQDLSHGAIQEITASRGIFAIATTGFTLSNAAVDATVKLYGAQSLKLTTAANDAYARISNGYYGRRVRHRIVYKHAAGATFQVRMDGASRGYDFTNHQWSTTATLSDLPQALDWSEWVSEWVETSATETGNFYLFMTSNNQESWVQEYHLEQMNVWTAVGDGTWSIPFVAGAGTWNNATTLTGRGINSANISNLFKGATWQDSTIIETTGSAPVTQGYSFLDTTNKKMVYLPVAGEDVTALHLERIFGAAVLQFSAGTVFVHNPVLMYNAFADAVSGTANVTYYNPIERCSLAGGFNTYGSTAVGTYHSPVSEQPRISSFDKEWGGGFISGVGGGTNTATMILNGATCIYSGDDSYQPADQTKMYINGATSYYPRGCDIEVSFQVANTGILSVRNFTGYGAYSNSYKDLTTGDGACAVTLTNCGFYSVPGIDDMTFSSVPTALNTYTMSNVFTGTTGLSGGAAYPVGFVAALTILATPPVADAANGDFTPTAGGAWQGTGTKWWAGSPNPVGGDGEPFQDVKPDVGGIQSKHSAMHPVNL